MATFTFTPDWDASVEVTPVVRLAKFGDGYEQRLGMGLNTLPKIWDLRFTLRNDAETVAIITFLENQAGVLAFDWVDVNAIAGKYVCRAWTRTKNRYNLNTITCKFEEVFEP
jgi:phage-related protein